jgi:hypothetical protein
MVTNKHQYVTKMVLCVSMGGLAGDFIIIFWIVEYLQMPIYIWNNVSKCIMSQCGMDFQSIPLHITYNSQHFEPIQYVNGLFRSLVIFQINDSKVTIDLNDFPSLSKSMIQ